MWTFQDSGSAIFVTRPGVGQRENAATGVTLLVSFPLRTVQFVGRWAGRHNQHATMCHRQGALDQGHRQFHLVTLGMCLHPSGLRLVLGLDPFLLILGKEMKGVT